MRLTRRELILTAAALPALADKKSAPRPNVLLVTVDGVGAWMLGCYGNREIRTPSIDLLARMGSRFSHCFAAAPVANQARAALLTGMTPKQLGFGADSTASGSLESQGGIAGALAAQGYECGYAGVWDSGTGKAQPGFKVWNVEPDYSAVTPKAAAFLDSQKQGQPFFLTAAYMPPPDAPAKYKSTYAATTFDSIGWEPVSPAAVAKDSLRDIVGNIRNAAAAVTAVDEQIGVLLQKLDQRGLRDNTVVIFTSTCGTLLGRHGLWGDGRATNPPNLYDEVMAVPLIWQWTGHTPPDAVRPEQASSFDLLPSICEAARAPLTAGIKFPGRSYLPLILNQPLPKKHPWVNDVFAEYGNAVMMRDKRYKLVLRDGGKGPGVLFDEVNDPRERVNQYDDPRFVSVRNDLTATLNAWSAGF